MPEARSSTPLRPSVRPEPTPTPAGAVGTWPFLKFAWRNASAFKAYRARDRLRVSLCLANMAIAGLDPLDPLTFQRIRELDQASIHHYQGKWYATRALASGERRSPYWQRAFAAFSAGQRLAERLHTLLARGSDAPATRELTPLHARGTEILFADDVPLVPPITPVVVLAGDDHQMGQQYAEQIAAIFGRWILRSCQRRFTDGERAELRRWEQVHAQHVPWLLDFVRGWVSGAEAQGVTLSYDEVLDLWVGHRPPATAWLDTDSGIPQLPPLACTSLAAWGRATPRGNLVAAATGDHDLSYQVTVVAYPTHGQPFIHTVFGATGTLPTVGPNWFFGHPGMNRAGLAYVHHGGGPKFLEPRSEWGHGLRRTPSVWHILRSCRTAREARDQEEAWPIGDVGRGDQATVGGFYADDDYGYVIEGRRQPRAIREAGLLGERDFLYANNSVMHPDAILSEWMQLADPRGWTWDREGGHRPRDPRGVTKSLGMMFRWFSGRMSMDTMLAQGMMFAYWNSWNRNVFLRRMADRHHGQLDVATLQAIYRTPGTMPEGATSPRGWAAAKRAYTRTGRWGTISVAHASNAFVAVMEPSRGSYSLCTGPARRGAPPMSPDFGMVVRGETNAFWDLELAESPAELASRAVALARDLERAGERAVTDRTLSPPCRDRLDDWLQEARGSIAAAESITSEGPLALGRRVRHACRAQVRARQVIDRLDPPRGLS